MSLFKVIVKETAPLVSEYHVDIPSDDFNEGMAIERIANGKKVSQISSHYDSTTGKDAKGIKVIASFPVDIKKVRAEGRSAREMLKILKAEKAKEEKEDKKAQQKTELKEKKS